MACTWGIPHLTCVELWLSLRFMYSTSLRLEYLKMQTKLDDFDVCVVTEKMVSDRWFSLIFAQNSLSMKLRKALTACNSRPFIPGSSAL
ncbi:hypothetical protein LB504_004700 [Fusarium proliferatum]|nr:hypothetical protein LB504_004700 [Fusarium proliferatum]